MGRRDIQFYDLYKLNVPITAVQELKQEGYWTEGIYDPEIYEDIEVTDFNQCFRSDDLIVKQFGQSIKVRLDLVEHNCLLRLVEEDMNRAEIIAASQGDNKSQLAGSQQRFTEKDLDLQVLAEQLENLQTRFKKTHDEMAELYVSVSGDIKKMRDYLSNKPGVITWNYLEDLALQKADDSPEFAVLLQEKGWSEICARRSFLVAQPQYAPDSQIKSV